ncbi:MAG: TIGR03862 family flavoprotein [Desulfobulbaceae bacterium]|jgi:uncharacterized flavoprotein (TIGR03862 family)|nr:TIGR03862 family flavoprotein [Desulfobulbaceae bacterium]
MDSCVVIGSGPAGLMAADMVLSAGIAVDLYEAMPTPARKLLAAGGGGLNLTTEEEFAVFLSRYPGRDKELSPFLRDFGPGEARAWAQSLGVATTVGASGRVYPVSRTSVELTRNWLSRLENLGLRLRLGYRWQGWDEAGRLRFMTEKGQCAVCAKATVLALGGGSHPQLGATGEWRRILARLGCAIAPFRPANCGFEVDFSAHFRERFAATRPPLKNVILTFQGEKGNFRFRFQRRGECLVTEYGLEGSLLYACGFLLRDSLEAGRPTRLHLDLFPDSSSATLATKLRRPQGSRSLAAYLEKCLRLTGVRRGLAYEFIDKALFAAPEALAAALKDVVIPLRRPRPLAEAISTAGGLCFAELDDHLMLRRRPGLFCCGEMLDWEAPTGGYLLTACLATGRAAGLAAKDWLEQGAALGKSGGGNYDFSI